jgi:uncharacterized membrane protein YhaH (DUF805 family)
MLMVNWKEDVEFFYCLFVLVSLIIAFFAAYPLVGVELAAVIVVILGLVEGIIGFAVFESEPALNRWAKMSKSGVLA